MTKKILVFLFVISFVSTIKAQYEYFVGGHLGGIAPTVLNQNTWGVQEYDYVFKPQIELGVDFSVLYRDDMQLSIGIWRTTLGQRYVSNYHKKNWKRRVRSDYFMFPLIFKKTVFKREHAKWFLGIGMLWALRQNAEQKWTRNGVAITQEQDYSIWGKPYWVSKPDVDDRYVRNDYMLYLDLGVRKYLSSDIFLDILAYGALGVRDINVKEWRIKNKSKEEYAASHNALVGLKLCLGWKFAQTGRFFLLDKVDLF